MQKVAILIDGGHLRVIAQKASKTYDPSFIEAFASNCYDASKESLIRTLYYDCGLYKGTQNLPISGKPYNFTASDNWLDDLASRDLFAVRRGKLVFRGWKPKSIPLSNTPLSDADFKPVFEQKGVDMRIGLDIASISNTKTVERIILVSADTDMVPAMKQARKSGLQVVIVQLPSPALDLSKDLKAHSDFVRRVPWP